MCLHFIYEFMYNNLCLRRNEEMKKLKIRKTRHHTKTKHLQYEQTNWKWRQVLQKVYKCSMSCFVSGTCHIANE